MMPPKLCFSCMGSSGINVKAFCPLPVWFSFVGFAVFSAGEGRAFVVRTFPEEPSKVTDLKPQFSRRCMQPQSGKQLNTC